MTTTRPIASAPIASAPIARAANANAPTAMAPVRTLESRAEGGRRAALDVGITLG